MCVCVCEREGEREREKRAASNSMLPDFTSCAYCYEYSTIAEFLVVLRLSGVLPVIL